MARITESLREQVFEEFGNRCAYCRIPELLPASRVGLLTLDHILPIAKGGTNEKENLCPACRTCNNNRSDAIEGIDPETNEVAPLFHPRKDRWNEHFEWREGGVVIVGKTPIGRATVEKLRMNSNKQQRRRREAIAKGLYPL